LALPLGGVTADARGYSAHQRNKLSRQNDWDVALAVGAHQQINPLIGNPGAYGEVSVSYNLASRESTNTWTRPRMLTTIGRKFRKVM
jgi:hypothetical protein